MKMDWMLRIVGTAALAAVALFASTPTRAQCISFAQPANYQMGVRGITTADFNGDGLPDLASIGVTNVAVVTVILANATPVGTFGLVQNYPTGGDNCSDSFVTTGDFNADGRSDIVATNNCSGSISVLLNNGDGSFQSPVVYPSPGNPNFIAVADYNADGVLDLAVGDGVGNTVSVFLGSQPPTSGTFQTPVAYAVGPNPRDGKAVDLNADGNIDLAIASIGLQAAVVLFGNGDGTFQSLQQFPLNANGSVVSGDFNSDGRVDLAVLGRYADTISVLLGSPIGMFAQPVVYPTSAIPGCDSNIMEVADFDADGIKDLVVGCDSGNYLSILIGNANGTFQTPINPGPIVGRPLYIVTGDFNGDGRPDVASARNIAPVGCDVILNTTPGRVAYVKQGATGTGTGQSWSNAFTELRDALALAATHTCVQEIWIAAGTYKPSPPLSQGGSRSASFTLQSNLALYGGFQGNETSLSQRTPATIAANPTILSGDIESDDFGDINLQDNSFHVIRASGTLVGSIIDGFQIQAGNADQNSPQQVGGGVFLEDNCSPTFRNCHFTGNRADHYGGAVAMFGYDTAADNSPLFENCRFTLNSAAAGGAVYHAGRGNSQYRNCDFERNSVFRSPTAGTNGGGAIYLQRNGDRSAGGWAIGCRFKQNSAPQSNGSAVLGNAGSVGHMWNCEFIGNSSGEFDHPSAGGTIYFAGTAVALLVDSIVVGNSSSGWYAGVGGSDADIRIYNSTIAFNTAANSSPAVFIENYPISTMRIRNSLIWNNSAASDTGFNSQLGGGGPIDMTFSTVQGWTGSPGSNNSSNPLFLRPPSPGPDQLWGTPDDDYGDLRLTNASPAIDSGDSTAVPQDSFDIDGDGNTTEALPLDILGNARFVDAPLIPNSGVGSPPVDRGAIEYFPPSCPSNGERLWVALTGGNYTADTSWFPCAPTAGCSVLFDQSAAYSVNFPTGQTISALAATIRRGNVTFNLNSTPTQTSTYRLTSTQQTALTVGADLGEPVSLTIPNGVVNATSAVIGDLPSSFGTINVSNATNLPGTGTRLAVTNGRLSVGVEGTGLLNVTQGGVVVSRDSFVGEQPGSFGRVIIDGTSSEAVPRPSRWTTIFGMTIDHGHVTVRNGGLLQADTIYIQQNSILDGNGTIQAVRIVNFGEIDPGNSPGTLTINGNYEQFGNNPKLGAASGRLNMQVGGTTPGTFDKLIVNGTSTLGGGITIDFTDGFTPQGDFVPLTLVTTSGATTGRFDVASVPLVPALPGQGNLPRFVKVIPTANGIDIGIGEILLPYNPLSPPGAQFNGRPVVAAVGDFDGENGPDLAIAIPGDTPQNNGTVLVFRNAGTTGTTWNGWQQNVTLIQVGPEPVDMVAADVDGTTRDDLVVATRGVNAADGEVRVLRNDGTGQNFSTLRVFDDLQAPPTTVAAAVLFRNGEPSPLPDIVIGLDRADDNIHFERSNDNGVSPIWIPPQPPDTAFPIRPRVIRPVDTDGDKRSNLLVVGNQDADALGSLGVIRNVQSSPVTAWPQFSVPVGTNPVSLAVGDLDGDGISDAVVANAGDGTISVVLNRTGDIGPVELTPAVNLPVVFGGSAISVALGDLDGDHRTVPTSFADIDIAVVAGDANGSNTHIYTLRNDTDPASGNLLSLAEPLALPPDPQGDDAPPLLVVTANVDQTISQSDDVIGLGEQGLGFLPLDTLTARPTTPNVTGPFCDDIDFNNDTSFFDPQDIDAFLSVYGEGPCIPETQSCNDIDFNNDGSLFDPCDIDAFLLVFSEGGCSLCGV